MRMRWIFSTFVGLSALLIPMHFFAQSLIAEHHLPQYSDSILAYKLPYIAITDSGRNCLWDFSVIPLDSAKVIEINYFLPAADTSLIGLHREYTNYYYHYSQDTLWQIGYETSHTHVHYSSPLPILCFPFAYGDSLQGQFMGKGQYCHLMPLDIEGTVVTCADAMGKLILPDITIDTALRVHSKIRYLENRHSQTHMQTESYYWYTPYCRYPILESVHVQTIRNKDTVSFASAYYFQQEQENLHNPRQEQHDSLVSFSDSLITNVTYLPNPVYTDLQIRYSLTRAAQVYISLHYNGGVTTYRTPVHSEEEGSHSVSVNMSGLPIGNYIVYIHADETVVAGNIVKL